MNSDQINTRNKIKACIIKIKIKDREEYQWRKMWETKARATNPLVGFFFFLIYQKNTKNLVEIRGSDA